MAYLISLPLQPCHIYQTLNLKSSTSNSQITQIFLKISNNLESINFTQAPKGIICKKKLPSSRSAVCSYHQKAKMNDVTSVTRDFTCDIFVKLS